MTKLTQAPPVQSQISWWAVKVLAYDGFTKYVEQTQQPRMAQSRLGKGRNRAISSDELEAK